MSDEIERGCKLLNSNLNLCVSMKGPRSRDPNDLQLFKSIRKTRNVFAKGNTPELKAFQRGSVVKARSVAVNRTFYESHNVSIMVARMTKPAVRITILPNLSG